MLVFHSRGLRISVSRYFYDMSWVSKIDRIVLLNLNIREDRLLESAEQFENYSIPYERVTAIHDPEQGARGLRDTMKLVFEKALQDGIDNLLVFEDDVKFVQGVEVFDDTMNKVMEQLPENYDMCMLGCQPTGGFSHFFSPNLLPVQKAYSTQAVLYSKKGMKEIMGKDFGYPIDNWFVDEIQIAGHSYCTYPLLASQRPGHSDIGHNFINWDVFITPKFEQKINEMRSK